jgi:hypothetical protein
MKLSFSSSAFFARARARREISDSIPIVALTTKKNTRSISSSMLTIA